MYGFQMSRIILACCCWLAFLSCGSKDRVTAQQTVEDYLAQNPLMGAAYRNNQDRADLEPPAYDYSDSGVRPAYTKLREAGYDPSSDDWEVPGSGQVVEEMAELERGAETARRQRESISKRAQRLPGQAGQAPNKPSPVALRGASPLEPQSFLQLSALATVYPPDKFETEEVDADSYQQSQPQVAAAKKNNPQPPDPKAQGPPPSNPGKKPGIKRRMAMMGKRKKSDKFQQQDFDDLEKGAEFARRQRDAIRNGRQYRGPWGLYGRAGDANRDWFHKVLRARDYSNPDGVKIVDYKIVTAEDPTETLSAVNNMLNFALGKPAFQSSDYYGRVAGRSVDGVADPDMTHGHCSQTKQDEKAWWYVDLGSFYVIDHVNILNTISDSAYRLRKFLVSVGNHTVAENKENLGCEDGMFEDSVGPGQNVKIICGRITGRYVHVSLMDTPTVLTMCNFEAFGPGPPQFVGDGKPRALPSGHPEDVHVLDGEDIVLRVSTRHAHSYQWTLGGSPISDGGRVQGARDKMLIIAHAKSSDSNSQYACEITGDGGTRKSRDVTVVVEMPGMQEVAMFKKAWLSSEYFEAQWHKGSRAVDGYEDSIFQHHHCACSDRQSRPWWVVDLGDVYSISFVRMLNRGDCCGERLNNFYVGVTNDIYFGSKDLKAGFDKDNPDRYGAEGIYPVLTRDEFGMINGTMTNTGTRLCGTIHNVAVPTGKTRQVSCKYTDETGYEAEPRGRFVVIQLDSVMDYLTLCHVEVYGKEVQRTPEASSCVERKNTMGSNDLDSQLGNPVVLRLPKDPVLLAATKSEAEVREEQVKTICDQVTYSGGWTLIMRHNASGGGFFNDINKLKANSENPKHPAYSIVFALHVFRSNKDVVEGVPVPQDIEYLMRWPNDPDIDDQWWVQTNNLEYDEPDTPVSGYKDMGAYDGWGGLVRKSNKAFVAKFNGGEAEIGTFKSEIKYGTNRWVNVVELYARERGGDPETYENSRENSGSQEVTPKFPDINLDDLPVEEANLCGEIEGVECEDNSWAGLGQLTSQLPEGEGPPSTESAPEDRHNKLMLHQHKKKRLKKKDDPLQTNVDLDIMAVHAVPADFMKQNEIVRQSHLVPKGIGKGRTKTSLAQAQAGSSGVMEVLDAQKKMQEDEETYKIEKSKWDDAIAEMNTAQKSLEDAQAAASNALADLNAAQAAYDAAVVAHGSNSTEASDAEGPLTDAQSEHDNVAGIVSTRTALAANKKAESDRLKVIMDAANNKLATSRSAWETAQANYNWEVQQLAKIRQDQFEATKELMAHDRSGKITFTEGLQEGIEDLWNTFKLGTVEGFSKGIAQGQAEVTNKFKHGYQQGYSVQWPQAYRGATSQRSQDETELQETTGQQNAALRLAQAVGGSEPSKKTEMAQAGTEVTGGGPNVEDDDMHVGADSEAKQRRQEEEYRRCREDPPPGGCQRMSASDIGDTRQYWSDMGRPEPEILELEPGEHPSLQILTPYDGAQQNLLQVENGDRWGRHDHHVVDKRSGHGGEALGAQNLLQVDSPRGMVSRRSLVLRNR